MINYLIRLIPLVKIATLATVKRKIQFTSLKKLISIILISIFFAGIVTPVKANAIKESQTKKESESYSTDKPEQVVKKEPKESIEEKKS